MLRRLVTRSALINAASRGVPRSALLETRREYTDKWKRDHIAQFEMDAFLSPNDTTPPKPDRRVSYSTVFQSDFHSENMDTLYEAIGDRSYEENEFGTLTKLDTTDRDGKVLYRYEPKQVSMPGMQYSQTEHDARDFVAVDVSFGQYQNDGVHHLESVFIRDGDKIVNAASRDVNAELTRAAFAAVRPEPTYDDAISGRGYFSAANAPSMFRENAPLVRGGSASAAMGGPPRSRLLTEEASSGPPPSRLLAEAASSSSLLLTEQEPSHRTQLPAEGGEEATLSSRLLREVSVVPGGATAAAAAAGEEMSEVSGATATAARAEVANSMEQVE